MSDPVSNSGQKEEQSFEGQDTAERSYALTQEMGFCPVKELNLPGSYEEVLARFNKLQGDRAVEILN